jgi:hypothetical protein
MSALKKLHSAKTIADVAAILEFKTKNLAGILYGQPDSIKYKEFDIPKKSGGLRRISAPQGGLKLLQRKLADLLQDCLEEINTNIDSEAKPFPQPSHGFKRSLSICTNARKHRNRRYVFNIDLTNFFGSINFGRVRGFFIKDKRFQLDPKVATILAQIACFKQGLPQGSPCSPVISNLIGNILDAHMVRLAARTGCVYTRYADDLTFSTNKRCFPQSIAIPSDTDNHAWVPGSELLRIVNHSGFSINPKKTRMQYHCSRQEVTGLVVNEKINIRSEYRHNTRAMAHRLFTKGDFLLPAHTKDENGNYSLGIRPGSLNQLHGRLGFINGIDRHNIENTSGSTESQIASKETIYRRFLFYKEFYVAPRPVLICEGWTDYIYIENALRQLSSDYSSLVLSDEKGKETFAIRRFKYSGSRTGKMLGMTGGTGDLQKFIQNYKHEFERFSVPGMKEPIILLIDNDSGSKGILNYLKKNCKNKFDIDKDHFIHIYRNLYLILTPLKAGKPESKIEDFFEDSTLEIKIGGKSFDPSNDKMTDTTYSKAVFAREVVEKRKSSINFEGFAPLLDRISAVLKRHYEQRKK